MIFLAGFVLGVLVLAGGSVVLAELMTYWEAATPAHDDRHAECGCPPLREM